MKQAIKIYLEPEIKRKLIVKAEELGFIGRGNLNKLIEKIALEPVVFIDGNLKKMLSVLNLSLNNGSN